MSFNQNLIYNGTHGKVWVDNVQLSQIMSIEIKQTATYEEVRKSGDLATYQRFMGYAISGTLKLQKIDYDLARRISEGFNSGVIPDIKINAMMNDPSNPKVGNVVLTGVTFDEISFAFENAKLAEEEFPFKAAKIQWL